MDNEEKAKVEGRGKVIVTFQLLKELLCLPDDAVIYGVEMTMDDLSRDAFKVFVKHGGLPAWYEGMEVRTVSIGIKTTVDIVKREFYGWQ